MCKAETKPKATPQWDLPDQLSLELGDTQAVKLKGASLKPIFRGELPAGMVKRTILSSLSGQPLSPSKGCLQTATFKTRK